MPLSDIEKHQLLDHVLLPTRKEYTEAAFVSLYSLRPLQTGTFTSTLDASAEASQQSERLSPGVSLELLRNENAEVMLGEYDRALTAHGNVFSLTTYCL